jgi:hypothetical protein
MATLTRDNFVHARGDSCVKYGTTLQQKYKCTRAKTLVNKAKLQ